MLPYLKFHMTQSLPTALIHVFAQQLHWPRLKHIHHQQCPAGKYKHVAHFLANTSKKIIFNKSKVLLRDNPSIKCPDLWRWLSCLSKPRCLKLRTSYPSLFQHPTRTPGCPAFFHFVFPCFFSCLVYQQ